jgi:hypothetical protein
VYIYILVFLIDLINQFVDILYVISKTLHTPAINFFFFFSMPLIPWNAPPGMPPSISW